MSHWNHVRRVGRLAVVMGLVAGAFAAAVPTAGAARRGRSKLDEGEREGRRPEVEAVVLRFVHIPAESFVDTLEQLGRNPKVHEGLEQIPLAVNEPANAVVVIAPPEFADMLRDLAEGLDQPNEFIVNEREREAEEAAMRLEMEERERDFDRDQADFELEMDRRRLDLERQEAAARMKMEEAKRRLAGPPPPPPPRPRGPHPRRPRMVPGRGGQPEPLRAPRPRRPGERRRPDEPSPRPGPEGRKPTAPRRHRPAPMHGPLGRLLSPRGRKALGLSEEQIEQIGDLARRVREHVHEVWQGVRERMRRAEPEDRKRILRDLKGKLAHRWADHRRRVMDRLEEILRPDQHERLEEWMRKEGAWSRPGRRDPAPSRRRDPKRRGYRRPSGEGHPPACRLL